MALGEEHKFDETWRQVGGKKVEEKWQAEDGGKATREVTSAVNNLSFKNQSEALIGAVA